MSEQKATYMTTNTDTKFRVDVMFLAGRTMQCPYCNPMTEETGYRQDCHHCNYTGEAPMFPMLRRECEGIDEKDIGVFYHDNCCDNRRWQPILTDAPMNALLGWLRELGWLYSVYSNHVAVRFRRAQKAYYNWQEGTVYQRLIYALAEAMRGEQDG